MVQFHHFANHQQRRQRRPLGQMFQLIQRADLHLLIGARVPRLITATGVSAARPWAIRRWLMSAAFMVPM